MMVTHNMKDALEYGNRTIMMHEGKIILDIDAETKKRIHVEDLLVMFEKQAAAKSTTTGCCWGKAGNEKNADEVKKRLIRILFAEYERKNSIKANDMRNKDN